MLIALARGQKLANGRYAPGWLENLQEAALGFTRIGDVVRYRRGDEVPLRLNLRASDLLNYAHSVLVEWIRDVCETAGTEIPKLSATSDLALWLAKNISAIASDEGAGVCYREIKEITRDIERIIDRPIPLRFCGACPAKVQHDDGTERECGTALMAKRDATEVTCMARNCRATHNVQELIDQMMADANEKLFTRGEIRLMMLTANESVPPSTFRRWFHDGHLKPIGFRCIDGADVPTYRLKDARDLRDKKPESRRKTRAS